jgi:hypothetical protein
MLCTTSYEMQTFRGHSGIRAQETLDVGEIIQRLAAPGKKGTVISTLVRGKVKNMDGNDEFFFLTALRR